MIEKENTLPADQGSTSSESISGSRLVETLRRELENGALSHADRPISISMAPLKRRNSFSSRVGGLVDVDYQKAGRTYQTKIWAKKVRVAEETYRALLSVYEPAQAAGVASPIPRPYAFDESERLIYTDAVQGQSLLKTTLCPAAFREVDDRFLSKLYYDIGHWLQQYHQAISNGNRDTLEKVLADTVTGVASDETFTTQEKGHLAQILDRIASSTITRHLAPVVSPHNDVTLRNIMWREDGSFSLIDWDSMNNPAFPKKELCWWDVTTFVLNMQSLLKVWPYSRRSRLSGFRDEFLSGYFSADTVLDAVSPQVFLQDILYLFTLRYWTGVKSGRTMWEIYRKNLGWRYLKPLRRALLEGRADLL
jgi:tRNA A-37 threonylcarbamoyl transferase component Bud32